MKKYPALQVLIETLPRTQVELLFNAAAFLLLPEKSAIDRLFQAQRVAETLNLTDAAPEVVELLDALVRADNEGAYPRIFVQLLAVGSKERPDSKHPKLGSRWKYIGGGEANGVIHTVMVLSDGRVGADSDPVPGHASGFDGSLADFRAKFVPE